MSTPSPSLSLPARLALAFVSFFKVLWDEGAALRIQRALPAAQAALAPPPTAAPVPPPASLHQAAQLHLLSMLQREGRFLDFLQEDITSFADSDVGAAARVVHEGCKKVLQPYLNVQPIMKEAEGDRVTVAKGFDPGRVRLTGNVVGAAPFTGSLKHKGWCAHDVKLPPPPQGMDASVLAPAEVEL